MTFDQRALTKYKPTTIAAGVDETEDVNRRQVIPVRWFVQ